MATVGAMVWLSAQEINALLPDYESRLTITPKRTLDIGDDPEPIEMFSRGRGGRVGLPLDFGVRLMQGSAFEADFEETLTLGRVFLPPRRPDPSHPKAPKGQGDFFKEIIRQMNLNYTVLAEAPTGSGKTVAILNTVAEFQRSALVIVPSKRLMYQWGKEAKLHLGLTDDQIGLVGDGHRDTEKDFVICIIHNLFQTIFPQEFYQRFGFVAWDECHKLGAREFFKTTKLFPATYRLAVSATPDRKDGCERLFLDTFGPVRVLSEQKPLPLVYEFRSFKLQGIPGSLNYCQSNARPLLWLSENEKYNDFITDLILEQYRKAKHTGEAVLVLTKFIEHAETLMAKCRKAGIPLSRMGMFTGQKTGAKKDGSSGRVKVTQAELDAVAKSATIIFATDGSMREGVDIPRIAYGVEAIPFADVRQAVGRARRVYEGKAEAHWISINFYGIRPTSKFSFLYQYKAARIKGLREVGGVTISGIK